MPSRASEAVDQFAAVLEATGGCVRRVDSPRAAAAEIATAATEQGVRQVLYEPCGLIEKLGIKLQLAAHGVELLHTDAAGDQAGNLRVSLTGAELAIAETGTLLVGGTAGGWGLATVLPWVHLVVVRADQVLPDLPTAFAQFAQRLTAGEGDWVWITGPSRTADIGQTLVLGAHGPNTLRVLVLP